MRTQPVNQSECGTEKLPLLLDLHGTGSNRGNQRSRSGWQKLALFARIAVLWPDGPFDAHSLRSLVNHTLARFPTKLDAKRVYVAGYSTGCASAQLFAKEASDLVAAVACHSGFLDQLYSWAGRDTAAYAPVSVMVTHGLLDEVVPYKSSFLSAGAVSNFHTWARRNGCSGRPSIALIASQKAELRTMRKCAGGTQVALLTLRLARHTSYGAFDGVQPTEVAWEFLRDKRLGRVAPLPGHHSRGIVLDAPAAVDESFKFDSDLVRVSRLGKCVSLGLFVFVLFYCAEQDCYIPWIHRAPMRGSVNG